MPTARDYSLQQSILDINSSNIDVGRNFGKIQGRYIVYGLDNRPIFFKIALFVIRDILTIFGVCLANTCLNYTRNWSTTCAYLGRFFSCIIIFIKKINIYTFHSVSY